MCSANAANCAMIPRAVSGICVESRLPRTRPAECVNPDSTQAGCSATRTDSAHPAKTSQAVSTILAAFILVAVTVVLHTVGLVALLMALMRKHARAPTRFWPMTLLLIEVTWVLVLIHATEIGVWALFLSLGGMPAGCRVGVLFLGSHLRDGRLRRCRAAATVADARTDRGVDGHSDVRTVHRAVLRGHRPIDRAPTQGRDPLSL